jgi:predicted Rossmann-fold nucleotide-binding protein
MKNIKQINEINWKSELFTEFGELADIAMTSGSFAAIEHWRFWDKIRTYISSSVARGLIFPARDRCQEISDEE